VECTGLMFPAVLVAALALVAPWLATGVQIRELAADAAYQIVFLLGPGVILYRALASSPGGALRQPALGWCAGYAAEVFVFSIAASLHPREAFDAYPLVVVLIAGGWWLRTRRRPSLGSRTAGKRALVLLSVAASVALNRALPVVFANQALVVYRP
jgi:hypothetical protein